jgi:type VI protein secretion system component Hcp
MTIQADIAVEAKIRALTANEIDAVSGGKVTVHDIVIVKTVDKSTPVLLEAAASAPAGQ